MGVMQVMGVIVLGVDGKIRKLSITFLIIIILIILVSTVWFLIPRFIKVEEPYQTIIFQEVEDIQEEKRFVDCCSEYLESNFTSFSTCPTNFNLALTSAIIKQDEKFLDLWNIEINWSEFPAESREGIKKLMENKKELRRYFIYAFGNEYLNKNYEVQGIKNDLINSCKNFIGTQLCQQFEKRLDLLYFPGTYLAKAYFEQEVEFCSGTEITSNLCYAVSNKNKTFCEFPIAGSI